MKKKIVAEKNPEPTPAPARTRRSRRRRSRAPRAVPLNVSIENTLNAMLARLAKAIQERATCQSKLALLNGEIPQLEHSIAVLRQQVSGEPQTVFSQYTLPPTVNAMPGSTPQVFATLKEASAVTLIKPRPELVPAATLPNDLSGMGSILPNGQSPSEDVPQGDDDALPNLGQGWA
jgi:hypothetical protein